MGARPAGDVTRWHTLRPVPARHVALNLSFIVPGETGGTETYARELLPALRAARPELRMTVLAAPEIAGEAGGWAERLEVVPLRIPARTRLARVAQEQTAVALLARRAGADVLHSLQSTAPRIARGLRQVVTIHDLNYALVPEAHSAVLAKGMAVLVPAAARAAARVVTDSAFVRDEVVARLGVPAARIDVVPLGPGPAIHPAPTPPAELRRRFGLGDDPLVLCVSARRGHKNLVRLCEAMRRLDGPARLVLPGYAAGLDDELRAAGGDRVSILGWIDDADLEGLYAAATCLAFPSLAEGFGLPVLEAMRRGLPVACSNATSLPEVAGDAALLFDPFSVEAIATDVGRLLGDPALRERLARLGRARAEEFSWARTAEGTLAAYDAAVA